MRGKLGNAQLDHSAIIVDRYALQYQMLKLFCSVATAPGIFIFFQVPASDSNAAKVFVIDEKGSFFTSEVFYYNQQARLRPLQNFISAEAERQKKIRIFSNRVHAVPHPNFCFIDECNIIARLSNGLVLPDDLQIFLMTQDRIS